MKDREFKTYIQENFLAAIGRQLHARRKTLKVSAESVAIAAGISRITLHRIESGEPGVSMAAYMSVMEAVGLSMKLFERNKPENFESQLDLENIAIKDFPQLKQISWQLKDDATLTGSEAKNMYERNERHINFSDLDEAEEQLIKKLGVEFKSRKD